MKLIAYLKQLPEDGREQFARDCETSVGHLRNVAYGYRPCAAELAVMIELRSQRQVTRQDVCPDNWQRIWPELAAYEAAQPQATKEAGHAA